MPRKIRCAEFDSMLIAAYLETETARSVAAKYNVSPQTVYRALKSRGIPRTRRHVKKRTHRTSNCNSDFCPALVMMLHSVSGMTGRGIARAVGCSNSCVYQTINRETGHVPGYAFYSKTCSVCGRGFKTTDAARSLCPECLPRENKANHRKRARRFGVAYVPGITLDKVVERDGNTCQICGKPCNRDDHRWGHFGPTYPTIDHIKPLSRGGGHTWENVQLAHLACNIRKSDKG